MSPLFNSRHINDCRSKYNDRHLLKFADNAVFIEDKVSYGLILENFVE